MISRRHAGPTASFMGLLAARRRAVVFDATAFMLVALIAWVVVRTDAGSGDYGQWLMVSRLYAGESVPAYRDLEAIPPLVPAMLAGVRAVVDDPFVAIDVTRALLTVGLLGAFYLAGAALFRSRVAGLFALVIAGFVADQILRLFAFGGLLQAAGLTFLLLGMAALAQVAERGGNARGWWLAAAGAFVLGTLSHAGSVAVAAPSLGLAAIVPLVELGRQALPTGTGGFPRARRLVAVLWPAALLAMPATIYWLAILAPANSGYGANPASIAFRGPERLIGELTGDGRSGAVILAGALTVGVTTGQALARRTGGRHAVLGAWTGGTWAVATATVAAGSATDYPRFAPLLMAPLIVAAGGGCARLCDGLAEVMERRWPDPGREHTVLASVLLLVAVSAPLRVGSFEREANGYHLAARDDVVAVGAWINENIDEQATVAAVDSRDGKWIEGLTGRAALFSNPIRYSFRREEWQRSFAAEAFIRGHLSLLTGRAFVIFTGRSGGEAGDVPRDPLFAFNHDGEFLDMLRAPDADVKVFDVDGEVLATLGALEPGFAEQVATGTGAAMRSTWTGARRGERLQMTVTVAADQASGAVDVIYEALGPGGIGGMQVLLRPPSPAAILDTDVHGPRARVFYAAFGARLPVLDVAIVDGGGSELTAVLGGVLARADGGRLHFRLSPGTVGASLSEPKVLSPADVMETFNVQAVVVREGPAAEARVARLALSGFCPRLRTATLVVLGRGCTTHRLAPIPHLAGDGR